MTRDSKEAIDELLCLISDNIGNRVSSSNELRDLLLKKGFTEGEFSPHSDLGRALNRGDCSIYLSEARRLWSGDKDIKLGDKFVVLTYREKNSSHVVSLENIERYFITDLLKYRLKSLSRL